MSRTRPQPVTGHGVALPDADQPDQQGDLYRGHIWFVCEQPAAGLYHLCTDRAGKSTYCGAYHPRGVCTPHTFGNGRLTAGNIVAGIANRRDRHVLTSLAYLTWRNDVELLPCPDCLTMAACESQMVASSRYPVVRLTRELSALPDDQDADTDAGQQA